MGNVRVALRVFAFVFAVMLFPALTLAQTGRVIGSVTDSSGAAVPSATVTATSVDQGLTRATQTNGAGAYALPNLIPTKYNIAVTKSGFQTVNFEGVVITIDQTLTLDAKLAVSSVQSTVEVQGNQVAPIDTTDAEISNVIDERQTKALPLILRDPYQLVLLSPGVTLSNTRLGGFSVNGQREQNNNFLLDGADNNDTDVPGIPAGLNSLNPDAVQEFRVITNNFAPEYGRDNGAIIDVKTPSGTNSIHGDVYFFGRYSATGARDFFNPVGTPQAHYIRNDFGASAGGPIIHNKTFWFANYEGQRFVTSITNNNDSPTQDFRNGKFTFSDPQAGIGPTPIDVSSPGAANNGLGLALDPAIQKIYKLFPLPTAPGALPGAFGLIFFPSTSRAVNDDFTVRVDHQLSAHNSLFVRYSFNRTTDPDPFHDDILPGDLGATSTYQRTQNGAIGLTSTVGNAFVNEFRFGANRTNLQFNCTGIATFDSFGFQDVFKRGADFGIPGITPTFGCGPLGDSNGQARFTGTYQTVDNMTKTYGTHTFKWGAEFRDVYSNSFDDFGTRTFFAFNSDSVFGIPSISNSPAVANFSPIQDAVSGLLGFNTTETQTQNFNKAGVQTPSDLRGFRQKETGLFIQDTWKLKPNFSLTYGLRWDYYGVPNEVNGNFSTLFADPSSPNAPFTFSLLGGSAGGQLYQTDLKGFSPRAGFAWDPFKTGKTSIRGGIGVFRDRLYGNLFENSRGNPPFVGSFNATNLNSLQAAPQPTPVTPSAVVTNFDPATFAGGLFAINEISPNFKTPVSYNYNFGVEHEFGSSLSLEVNYVGVRGFHEFRDLDANPNQPALISKLEAFCVAGNPANTGFSTGPNAQFGTAAGQCSQSTLQFANLRLGAFPGVLSGNGVIPFNAANNTAFLDPSTLGTGGALITSIAKSWYNGLQVNVKKQYSHGIQIQGAYTYSHSIDNASDPLSPGAGNRGLPRNSFNLGNEYGNSDFDVRHRAVINFVWDPNIGRGKDHMSNGLFGRVLEGWELAGIAQWQSGLPYDVFGFVDTQHTGVSDRATVSNAGILHTAPVNPSPNSQVFTGVNVGAFNPDNPQIAPIPFGVASNVHRNQFFGPGINNWDAVLSKTTSITERLKLELRFEGYNLFNRPQFQAPANGISSSLFGYSTLEATRNDGTTAARQLQFAAKLHF